MTDTANLGLPCIEAAQAQKHVTHNEALRLLDTLVQLAVLDRHLAAPPGSPAEGQRWIVAASPTGAWAGHATHVAAWQDGAWQFSVPHTGWIAYVVDEGTLVTWNGSAWGDFFSTVTAIQNLALLGVGTTADSTNPLSAKLNNALWVAKTTAEGGTGDLRYKLSKAASGNTLSLLLQDNFSGRAEVGLTADDNFHCKVSADGSTWFDALVVQASSGATSVANTAASAFAVGAHGAINPAFQVDASAASVATGWMMKGAAAAAGAALSVISSGSNENATIDAKGAGTLTLQATATGNVAVGANKVTIAPASGNVAIAGTLSVTGDLAVNTNKFNVTAVSGNTAIAGTLGVTGATTLAGASATVLTVGTTNAENTVARFHGGTMQVTGTAQIAPSAGVGLELFYDGTRGAMLSFNRNTTAFAPLLLAGSTIAISSGPVMVTDTTATSSTTTGALTVGGGLGLGGDIVMGGSINASGAYKISSLQVVGARSTGWTAMTGTADKASAFATSTVTLAQLAGRVMALQAALTTHGLLGT